MDVQDALTRSASWVNCSLAPATFAKVATEVGASMNARLYLCRETWLSVSDTKTLTSSVRCRTNLCGLLTTSVHHRQGPTQSSDQFDNSERPCADLPWLARRQLHRIPLLPSGDRTICATSHDVAGNRQGVNFFTRVNKRLP